VPHQTSKEDAGQQRTGCDSCRRSGKRVNVRGAAAQTLTDAKQGDLVSNCPARDLHDHACPAHIHDDPAQTPVILSEPHFPVPHADTDTCAHTHILLEQPYRPSQESCLVLRKSSDMSKHLIKQWNALTSDDDPHDVYRGQSSLINGARTPVHNATHEWNDDVNDACPTSGLHAYTPQELHFTAPNDNLLRAHARLITPHVTSKPLTTLYDGEIMYGL
jgi:hypothetical protein